MSRVRVKICGLTCAADIALCEQLGVDMVGLVFAPQSKRQLSVALARRLLEAVRWARPVGLFMNQSAAEVEAIVRQLPQLSLLQFHGNESAEFCRTFQRPYLKAIAMNDLSGTLSSGLRSYPDASALLLDAQAGDQAGGSGETFDWTQVPDCPQPLIVAGGLTPDNVAEAIAVSRPFAVDVSSGVEMAPGRKDPAKLRAFFDEVNRARN